MTDWIDRPMELLVLQEAIRDACVDPYYDCLDEDGDCTKVSHVVHAGQIKDGVIKTVCADVEGLCELVMRTLDKLHAEAQRW